MADQFRVLVAWTPPGGIARDTCTNTLYFQKEQILQPTDYQDLVDDVYDVYKVFPPLSGYDLDIRIYNMEDPKPREIRAQNKGPADSTYNAPGPREVALCLSYHGDRNIPRQRGRVYLGPFTQGLLTERPSSTLMAQVRSIGQALAGIGGEDISWRVRSVKSGEYHHIRFIWVDNEWDTQRSRGLRATTKSSANV